MKALLKEYLSHRNIWIYFALFLILLSICISFDLIRNNLWAVALPIVLEPFYEWFAHKILLHRKVNPTNSKAYNYQLFLHYNHHTDPSHLFYVFAPLSAGLTVILKTGLLVGLVLWSSEAIIVGAMSAAFSFLVYEWFHLGHHVANYVPVTPMGKLMRKYHMLHHHHNENYWWGVITPIADIALGTFKRAENVPRSATVKNIQCASEQPTKNTVAQDFLRHQKQF